MEIKIDLWALNRDAKIETQRELAEKYGVSVGTINKLLGLDSQEIRYAKVNAHVSLQERNAENIFPLWEFWPEYQKEIRIMCIRYCQKYNVNKSAQNMADFVQESFLKMDLKNARKAQDAKWLQGKVWDFVQTYIAQELNIFSIEFQDEKGVLYVTEKESYDFVDVKEESFRYFAGMARTIIEKGIAFLKESNLPLEYDILARVIVGQNSQGLNRIQFEKAQKKVVTLLRKAQVLQ